MIPIYNPQCISRKKKEKYLLDFSEDEFRDFIIRSLFYSQGLKDGRELCGPLEEGKDTIFISEDELGFQNIYAVQTKKGNLNMASKAASNVLNSVAQLRTAIETKIPLLKPRRNAYPNKVFLCVSGKINTTARKHINDEIKDPRLEFLDCDELIPMIDDKMPELWFGVNLEKYPYLNQLHSSLTATVTPMAKGISENNDPFYCPVTADNYVNIKLNHLRMKKSGKNELEPDFEELSVKQLLSSKHLLILITGEAGLGKSTAIRRMACISAEKGMKSNEDICVPILIRAKDIVESEERFEIILRSKTEEFVDTNVSVFSKLDLDNGFVIVFIDGLDEIPKQVDRIAVINVLNVFHNKYPNVKMFLSSRNYSWLEKLPDINRWVRFRISPIDWKQTTQIVKRLKKQRSISNDQLQEVLRRLQDVHGLQLNPLLVSVFVASSDYTRRDIPANITEIIKKYTEMMLGRWDTSKGFSQQFQAPLKDFLLQTFAFFMHENRITHVSLTEFTAYLEEELKQIGRDTADVETLTDEIVYRSGLFRIIGGDIEFAHLILQEFFAGRYLNDSQINNFFLDDWWQRAIVFHAGDKPNNLQLLSDFNSYLTSIAIDDRTNALLTLGLSLQASYLLKTIDKIGIYSSIIKMLAHNTTRLIDEIDKTRDIILMPFIHYYLMFRDAVSCDVQVLAEEQIKNILSKKFDISDIETIEFWQIVALLECGAFDRVLLRLKSSKLQDKRYYLAIHLGAFFYKVLRTSSKTERRKLSNILRYIDPKIIPLRKQLHKEIKSDLLELRKGKVVPLDDTEDDREE